MVFILQWVSLPEEISLVDAFLSRGIIFGRAGAAKLLWRSCGVLPGGYSEPQHPACCPRALLAGREEADSRG